MVDSDGWKAGRRCSTIVLKTVHLPQPTRPAPPPLHLPWDMEAWHEEPLSHTPSGPRPWWCTLAEACKEPAPGSGGDLSTMDTCTMRACRVYAGFPA